LRAHAIQIDQPALSLREALHGFFVSMLAPMQQGDLVQLCTRLHFREMLEPTGVWADKIDNGIKPAHAALVRVLCRHLRVRRADDDLHRLAFSIAGLALQVFMTRDVIEAIRPTLLANPRAIDAWCARLVDFADAMVTQEATRRAARPATLTKKTP
ncbi:MAG: DUF1956 domain-containing protein, partial [Pseudomonadota bacterium]|nr:DUF1956 domain-containing protein [Pseudomonadota bacterium]